MSSMPSLEFDLEAALAQPYPGLRSFEPLESFIFFGRRSQINELLRRLSRGRMLAVVGTSGSGKSSLVRAGLLPALYRGHLAGSGSTWRVAIMRPGGGPLDKLADALVAEELFAASQREEVRKTIGMTSLGLVDAIQKSKLGRREALLILVDQFEELFRFRAEHAGSDGTTEVSLFVAALLEAIDQVERPIYVVLTMRSDFLVDCAEFAGLPEALNRNQYLVPRMTRNDRQEAIEGPLRVAGANISARLVQRVLNDAGDDPDQLPILQHALLATYRAWKKRGGQGDIDLADYEAAGTLVDAINRDAQSLLDDIPAEDRKIAERIFRCLTSMEGGRAVRRAARFAKILGVIGASGDSSLRGKAEGIVRRFTSEGRSFLILPPGTQIADDCVVDITHESLIRKWSTLRDWAEREADSADWYRSVVRDAKLYQAGRSGVWRNPELKEALRLRREDWNTAWSEQYGGGFDAATKFLETSKVKRRRNRILLCAAGIFVFTGAAAGYGKYRYDLYQDKVTELSLQQKVTNATDQVAEATNRTRVLEAELSTKLDPAEKKALQQQLDEQTKQLALLKQQSQTATQQLASHNGDQASQDMLLKQAYSQIDSLRAQVGALRQGQCAAGYVPRNAVAGDRVCVAQAVADQVTADNQQAAERRAGSGPYGADTCKQGFVWREATPGDHVCVLPNVRDQAAMDNRQAQFRLAAGASAAAK
jgi:energy-coupling factor transporter ATP-binding protein EcfA2